MREIFELVYSVYAYAIQEYSFVTIPIIIILTSFVAFPGFLPARINFSIRIFIKYSILVTTAILMMYIFTFESPSGYLISMGGLIAIIFISPMLISSAILLFVSTPKKTSKQI